MSTLKLSTFVFALILMHCHSTRATAAASNDTALENIPSDRFFVFRKFSVIFGISTKSSEDIVSAECHAHLLEFQRAVLRRDAWAMKMFDASGAVPTGFIYGDNYWLGSRETCEAARYGITMAVTDAVPHKMHPGILSQTAPYAIDYRVAYLQHNSTWQVDPVILFFKPHVHLGLCLPSTCSSREVKQLLSAYLQEDELFVGRQLYDMELRVSYIKELTFPEDILTRPSLLIVVGVTLFTLAMALAAFLLRRDEQRLAAQQEASNGNGSVDKKVVKTAGVLDGIIRCYDMQSNWSKLFVADKMKNKSEPFFALSGIRFLSSLAVTAFHFLLCFFMTTRNKVKLFTYLRYIGNFDIFLDIFFTMGGFFYAYLALQNEKFMALIRRNNLKQNIKLIIAAMFHRVLRLAPLYYLTNAITDVGSKYFSELSLFHYTVRPYIQCEKYWWRSMIFIQNFFAYEDMCSFWTWSLACDLQFFLISTIIFFIYAKHPKLGKLLTLAVLVSSALASIIMGFKYNFQYSLESVLAWLSGFYINPLPRIFPHIVGAIGAWAFLKYRARIAARKTLNEWLGHLNLIIYFSVIFIPIEQNHSVMFSIILLLLQRAVYAVSTCYLFIMNACGFANWFYRIFELSFFQTFSQASFANFLLHPLVIVGVAGASGASWFISPLTLFAELLMIIIVLLFLSTISTLLYEMPYRNMSKLMMQSGKEKVT